MSLADHNAKLAANERQPVSKKGSFLALKEATGSVRVEIDGQTFTMVAGDYAEIRGGFESFYVTDTSGAANSVTFVIGDGDFRRFVITGQLDLAKASVISSAAVTVGTSQAILAAASTGRKELRIQNLGTVDVYIGETGVTTATGIKLAPGQTHFEDTAPEAAWYAISGTAGQDVRVQGLS